MRLWVGHNPPYSGPRMLVGWVRRAPAPLRRAIVSGGRPALRPFAAAPRPVASARRPAPRAPLRVLVLSVVVCGVHRWCGVRRLCFIAVGAVGCAPSGPSWARYARSALNGPSWGSPSLPVSLLALRAFIWLGRVCVGPCAPRSASAMARYAPHADAARCAPVLSPLASSR